MASESLILRFITLSSLILLVWLLCQADYAYANNNSRVKLSLYYESLCPFSANFIVNKLAKVFKKDLMSTVDLRLIPWGNAKISSKHKWICQHGSDECLLNTIQACAVNAWPKVDTHFKFVHCVERLHLMQRHTEWRSCFNATGLDPRPVMNCYKHGHGYKLEKAYAKETAKLKPSKRFVPWVVVNNLTLGDDYWNFIPYICKAYKGRNVPKACKSRRSISP